MRLPLALSTLPPLLLFLYFPCPLYVSLFPSLYLHLFFSFFLSLCHYCRCPGELRLAVNVYVGGALYLAQVAWCPRCLPLFPSLPLSLHLSLCYPSLLSTACLVLLPGGRLCSVFCDFPLLSINDIFQFEARTQGCKLPRPLRPSCQMTWSGNLT